MKEVILINHKASFPKKLGNNRMYCPILSPCTIYVIFFYLEHYCIRKGSKIKKIGFQNIPKQKIFGYHICTRLTPIDPKIIQAGGTSDPKVLQNGGFSNIIFAKNSYQLIRTYSKSEGFRIRKSSNLEDFRISYLPEISTCPLPNFSNN